ncbi:hypothetical protein CVT26_016118, partial [Gymnopilus dilepis]
RPGCIPKNWSQSAAQIPFRNILRTIAWCPLLPASMLLYFMYHYQHVDSNLEDSLDLADVGGPQWKTVIAGITFAWKTCQLASTGLIASVLAVLQIPTVFGGIASRTFAMATVLCSCACLVSSTLWMASKEDFLRRRAMDKWKAASGATHEFWILVALPVSFILWSSTFFLVILVLLVWDLLGPELSTSNNVSFIISAIFLTSIPIASGVMIFFAMKQIRRF